MFDYDVFISYSSKDKNTIHDLAKRLKNDGLRVWLDQWEIQPGDSVPIKIEHGLEKSRTLVMCMSPAYFESEWGKLEHNTILFRDPTNKGRRLIPLIIEDCNLPDILAHFAYIDWRIPSNKEYERLFTSCLKNNSIHSPTNLSSHIQSPSPKYNLDNKEGILMPCFFNFQVPPPSNWQDFESLCWDLWRGIWEEPYIQKNGRQGQQQNGVDIYGRLHNGILWGGIQCKLKSNDTNKSLTESDVKEEVEKAKNFKPKLSKFIIATTAPKDAKIEEYARKVTEDHLKEGLFSVHIMGWEDIKERLDDYPRVRDKYYPQKESNLTEIKENDIFFKRENAAKITEELIKPLRDCASCIKLYFQNGDYILNLENRAIKLNLKFNGYEFIEICVGSNRFRYKDGGLVSTYGRDEVFNKYVPKIISFIDSYMAHIITLKTTIGSLNASHIPNSFESDISIFIENPSHKTQIAEENYKIEYLFNLYATLITGKKSFCGHSWATTLKENKSKEVLEIIKKDPYSNEIYERIESLKKEIVLDIDGLIKELNNLDDEFQNTHYL
ncbi:toll/interleukin-1 receptor domain-containing protein [Methanosarcina mazei]|uniref:TIR domain-containing protein n=1 Tax=Methanosarcina mazei TaxID=2209 RepID=A0A0F8I2A9_METMZ|nr:toll/interleukin-1 receptor domain-containing protein [Methanosarcina mazei]KKG83066.1 hypothetical protein DU55_08180 [Methanosarcina mazei]